MKVFIRHTSRPRYGSLVITKRLSFLLPAALAGGLLLTAGSCDRKGLGDAPVGPRLEDERTVIVMPDKFPNLAVVCDGSTRIYVTTREAAPIAVPDHPACAGELPLDEQGTDVSSEER